jgi:hypothetical protein
MILEMPYATRSEKNIDTETSVNFSNAPFIFFPICDLARYYNHPFWIFSSKIKNPTLGSCAGFLFGLTLPKERSSKETY